MKLDCKEHLNCILLTTKAQQFTFIYYMWHDSLLFLSNDAPAWALHSSLIIFVAVVVVFHLWHLKMSIECTVPKTYDNLADDWLTLTGSYLELSSLLYNVVLTNLYKNPYTQQMKKRLL